MKGKFLIKSIIITILMGAIVLTFNYLPYIKKADNQNKTISNQASTNTDQSINSLIAPKQEATYTSIKTPDSYNEVPATAVDGIISVKIKTGTDIFALPALKDKVQEVQSGLVFSKVILKPGVDKDKVLAEIKQDDRVDVAGPVHEYYPSATFNDTYYANEWHMPKINVQKAYDYAATLQPVKVAVVDTGVSTTHPDLAGKIVAEYNAVYSQAGPGTAAPVYFHGTHVTGIIAANANNNTGVAGVAPNAQIIAVNAAYNSSGLMLSPDIANGIYWATDHGAQIINLSMAGVYDVNIHYAVNYAMSKGVIVVAADGNGPNIYKYPAALPGVVAVSATNSNDQLAYFSNYGPEVAVAAPGDNIYSTYWDAVTGDGYKYESGTSMAAPMVSGEAAVIWGSNPGLTASQVVDIIKQNSDDLGSPGVDNQFGYGRINIGKALYPNKINLDSPVNNSVLRGTTVQIQGWALNITGVTKVEALNTDETILLGSTIFKTAVPGLSNLYPNYPGGDNNGFTINADSTLLPDGPQILRIKVTGVDNSIKIMEIPVYIDNAPQMNIENPLNGSTVSGVITLRGWAIDSLGIAEVSVLKSDKSPLGTANIGIARPDVNGLFPGYTGGNNWGFTYPLDTTLLPNGWQTIWIVAKGNDLQTITRFSTVYVNNPSNGNPVPSSRQSIFFNH